MAEHLELLRGDCLSIGCLFGLLFIFFGWLVEQLGLRSASGYSTSSEPRQSTPVIKPNPTPEDDSRGYSTTTEPKQFTPVERTKSIRTKIIGVTYSNPDGTKRQELVAQLKPNDTLTLRRDRDNPKDPNAVSIFDHQGRQLGFVKKELAASVAPYVEQGRLTSAVVLNITGGGKVKHYGVNIALQDVPSDVSRPRSRQHQTYRISSQRGWYPDDSSTFDNSSAEDMFPDRETYEAWLEYRDDG